MRLGWWPMPHEPAHGLALIKRAITGTATVTGRSRRSEFGYYWVAAMVTAAIVRHIPHELPWRADWILDQTGQLLLMLPVFALFVRRLHDVNLTGWWALSLPPIMGLSIYSSARFVFLDPQNGALALPELPLWASLFQLGGVLFFLAVLLIPGTDGPNRFGPDPRRSIDPEQLRARDQQDEAERAQDPLLG
ncbi:MAG: DUF805 domain-containing protein [Sphingomonadales bacterium]|nr:MAG: DUF805 domain-containing protein [Sphingomonadales bacterium]